MASTMRAVPEKKKTQKVSNTVNPVDLPGGSQLINKGFSFISDNTLPVDLNIIECSTFSRFSQEKSRK